MTLNLLKISIIAGTVGIWDPPIWSTLKITKIQYNEKFLFHKREFGIDIYIDCYQLISDELNTY